MYLSNQSCFNHCAHPIRRLRMTEGNFVFMTERELLKLSQNKSVSVSLI